MIENVQRLLLLLVLLARRSSFFLARHEAADERRGIDVDDGGDDVNNIEAKRARSWQPQFGG